jgi:hypothetical protein
MQRPGTGTKRALYLALACLGVLGLYWLKNLADINLFRHFSLHQYFPFSLLQHDKVILQPRGAVAIEEGFEALLPVPTPWHRLSTNRPGKVQLDYELAANGSRQLVVTSQHKGWWHISHRYAIAVEPGDTFTLGGTLWRESAGGYGQLQVSALDAAGKVTNREMWAIQADGEGRFQRVEKVFTVPQGVSRIMLRIAGRGEGRFKFDDLILEPGDREQR